VPFKFILRHYAEEELLMSDPDLQLYVLNWDDSEVELYVGGAGPAEGFNGVRSGGGRGSGGGIKVGGGGGGSVDEVGLYMLNIVSTQCLRSVYAVST
jgi:hypothetical protein